MDLLLLQAAKQSSEHLRAACQLVHGSRADDAANIHLSCLKALHTSVTSPSQGRPAFLPQAVALYREARPSHAICMDSKTIIDAKKE